MIMAGAWRRQFSVCRLGEPAGLVDGEYAARPHTLVSSSQPAALYRAQRSLRWPNYHGALEPDLLHSAGLLM